MAILCANCGRQYDVTLFQFGRTIDCACGNRVGLETRINLPGDAELRFFADVNVGRLTRWLRALSLDTAWEDAIPDGDLVRRALQENRYILTLDKRLPAEWRVGNVLLLEDEDPLAQLREVVRHFQISKPEKLFERCLICNALMRKASDEEILMQVPPNIRETEQHLSACPNCRKVYWEGSHTNRMRQTIESIFESKIYPD